MFDVGDVTCHQHIWSQISITNNDVALVSLPLEVSKLVHAWLEGGGAIFLGILR